MGRVQKIADRVAATPPLSSWRRRKFDADFNSGKVVGCCRGVYSSYAAAAAAAPMSKPLGYDHPEAGAMYRDRLYKVYPSDYAMMFWLQKLVAQGARRIFDYGGHIGLSYYAYERMFPFPADLRWQVCDLPAIAEAGRLEARSLDVRGQLLFTSDISEAANADVLFTAGCLQFLDKSLADLLAELPRLPASVLINLLPLHNEREYWTLMSIGTAYCPYYIQQTRHFFDSLSKLGYCVDDRWENLDKDCWVAFEPDSSLDRYHGAALSLERAPK